jgi:hypothetical protein
MADVVVVRECREACPVCDGQVVPIRGKLICSRCRSIVETCCDGGRQGSS